MTDADYMQLAISEAKKGIGLTSPNPVVGAVIVKDGLVLGKGWHRKAGQAHAEREAIANVLKYHSAEAMVDSTIYVTLEPCSTQGKTAACVDGIIEAGISRVVYGSIDPNPAHAGAANQVLSSHGVSVRSGVEREACDILIKSFKKQIITGLPWVIAKTAMSLDGRITRPKDEGQWLTDSEAREEVHRIRATVDAIITSGKTVRKDNPSLTIRGEAYRPEKQQPWRVVLTQSGKETLSANLHLFSDEHQKRTLVHEEKTLEETLQELVWRGCNTVLLECGGGLMHQFIEQGLVDEVAVFIAPIITGGTTLGFGLGEHFKRSYALPYATVRAFGNDLMIRGDLKRSS